MTTDHLQKLGGCPPIAYTIRDAAKASGLGRTTLYKLIETGALASVKIAGRRLIRHSDLDQLFQRNRLAA